MSDISLAKSELTGRVYAVISPKRKQDVTAYVDYLINDATQKLQNEHADLKAKLAVAVEANRWQVIETDGLPELRTSGVLLQVENSHGLVRFVRANYYPENTLEDMWGDDGDFAPAGWYEECDSNPSDMIYPVNGKPIAWRLMPEPHKIKEAQ